LPWAGIRTQKAITMHHHRHTAAVMESEQTAVTSAFMQTGLVIQILQECGRCVNGSSNASLLS